MTCIFSMYFYWRLVAMSYFVYICFLNQRLSTFNKIKRVNSLTPWL